MPSVWFLIVVDKFFRSEMSWMSGCVLLSFAALFIKVHAQGGEHSPPTFWVDPRSWHLYENETVGSRIAQVHEENAEGGQLIYGLEPSYHFGSNIGYNNTHKLPFRIDPQTGTIYLNATLQGRGGENFRIYVTAYDGNYPAKVEINVVIQDPNVPYNPSKPNRSPFGKKPPAFANFPPDIYQRPYLFPQTHIPNYSKITTKPPFFQQKTYPEVNYKPQEGMISNKSEVTQLKPVRVGYDEKQSLTYPEKKPEVTTTMKTGKTNDDDKEEEKDDLSTNELSPKPIKSPSEFTAAVIPIISVCVVFITVGAVALIFRRKIYFGKRQDSKDDMRKTSSASPTTITAESGLGMHEWIGPRALSNRYEPWQNDYSHTQVENQLSTTVKNVDRWEFPRHRLKFFSILGEGAFGQVWKCEALDLKGKDTGLSIVAVKTLKENANEKERSDIVSELQVMKTLEPHPNVVRLLGCCTDKDPIFLIMEYVSRGKLQSYLRNSRAERYYNNMHGKSKSLTSRDLTSFVYQVARGMEFLSVNGIIHRDLAARNILITEDHICKVADFGFARDITASHMYERKSEGRLPIRWMAPESLYDNIYSVKSDVWSFGVFIWEVVTLGSTPYPGMSAGEVMKKVKDNYRLDKPEHCRRELYNIMYYCWDKDPNQRPSFTECVELLEKLLMTETDYIELERFPDHSYYNMVSLSGEKL